MLSCSTCCIWASVSNCSCSCCADSSCCYSSSSSDSACTWQLLLQLRHFGAVHPEQLAPCRRASRLLSASEGRWHVHASTPVVKSPAGDKSAVGSLVLLPFILLHVHVTPPWCPLATCGLDCAVAARAGAARTVPRAGLACRYSRRARRACEKPQAHGAPRRSADFRGRSGVFALLGLHPGQRTPTPSASARGGIAFTTCIAPAPRPGDCQALSAGRIHRPLCQNAAPPTVRALRRESCSAMLLGSRAAPAGTIAAALIPLASHARHLGRGG